MHSPHSQLAEHLANQLPDSTANGDEVAAPFDLSITCRVASAVRVPSAELATLEFSVSHPTMFPAATPNRFRGTSVASDSHIVDGARFWSQTTGQAIFDAIKGERPDEIATIIGRTHNSYIAAFDRVFGIPSSNAEQITQKLRHHFGGDPWLTSAVINSGTLPVTGEGATILSVAIVSTDEASAVEVTINGGRWRPAERIFDDDVKLTRGTSYLSESAVLIPTSPPTELSMPVLEHTLAGLAASVYSPESAAGWLGWRAHGGVVQPPLSPTSLQQIEANVGHLPADYRHFITTTSGGGAGPGYGLLAPTEHDGAILLADAGCGRFWELRLDKGRRGEVWLYTSEQGSTAGEGYDFVYPNFSEWYNDWLQFSIAQRGPWMQWSNRFCAATATIRRRVQQLNDETGLPISDLRPYMGPGSLAFTSADGDVIRPCHGCVVVAKQFRLDDSVFSPPNATSGANATPTIARR